MAVTELYPEVKEEWVWEALYEDGTVLKHIDGQTVHKFSEIDQLKLTRFRMVHETRAPITIHWRPGLKLIHFIRHRIVHTTGGELRYSLYCFGYQEGSSKTIMVIAPDGSLIITDDVDKVRGKVE